MTDSLFPIGRRSFETFPYCGPRLASTAGLVDDNRKDGTHAIHLMPRSAGQHPLFDAVHLYAAPDVAPDSGRPKIMRLAAAELHGLCSSQSAGSPRSEPRAHQAKSPAIVQRTGIFDYSQKYRAFDLQSILRRKAAKSLSPVSLAGHP